MRDNDVVADSLGKNLRSLRTSSLVIGGAIAGLSGGMLVGFINLWDPQAWGYAETIVLFAAVIIGGLGNHRGAMLGAILVPVAFEEATRYIPPVSGNPNLVPALQWVVIGLLILVFLWFRPQGILPERRRKLATRFVAERAAARCLDPRRRRRRRRRRSDDAALRCGHRARGHRAEPIGSARAEPITRGARRRRRCDPRVSRTGPRASTACTPSTASRWPSSAAG